MAEICGPMEDITYRPIGVVRSPVQEPGRAPMQSILAEYDCEIEIFPEYSEGLNELEGFSHIIVIYHLHRVKAYSLMTETPHRAGPKGVFATRSPRRPNPIGLSIVPLRSISENILVTGGLDAMDGTPVLDIKPFIPECDVPEGNVVTGWLKGRGALRRNLKIESENP